MRQIFSLRYYAKMDIPKIIKIDLMVTVPSVSNVNRTYITASYLFWHRDEYTIEPIQSHMPMEERTYMECENKMRNRNECWRSSIDAVTFLYDEYSDGENDCKIVNRTSDSRAVAKVYNQICWTVFISCYRTMNHEKIIKYLELLALRKIVWLDGGDTRLDLRIGKKIIDCFVKDWQDENFDSLRASFRRTWTDDMDTSDETVARLEYKKIALAEATGVRIDKLVPHTLKDIYKYCEQCIRPMRWVIYDDLLARADIDG